MTKAHHIETEPTTQLVQVVVDGVTVADSRSATILREGSLPPRYYVPLEDVRQDLLRPSTKQTTCPFKGEASYWSLEVNGNVHDDIVWTYRDPLPERRDIAGLVCFYNERVDLKLSD